MGALIFMRNYIVVNLLTLVYGLWVIFMMLMTYFKNIFSPAANPKIRLTPPPCLTDAKYGTHKYIKVNNIKLHYVSSGDESKPLILFIHGFPEFWYSWRHQIVEFNKDFWCVAIDMRGYGDSEKPEGTRHYKLEVLIEDIRDLIKQLGREKCVIVSHDWGGVVTAKFRDVYPEMLLGCVVAASTSIEAWHELVSTDTEQMKMSWYIFAMRTVGIMEWFFQSIPDFFENMMKVPGKDTVTDEDIECYKYWYRKQGAFIQPMDYYRANVSFTMPEKKRSETNVPYLFAQAQNDRALSLKLSDVMKKHYAHIETTTVEGCRHFMQQEEPEKFNQLVRDFLKRHEILK